MKKLLKIGTLLLFTVVFITACKKDKDDVEEGADFDKKSLLVNLADNIIVPQYLHFQGQLTQLSTDYQLFLSNPSSTNLTVVQDQLLETYLSWQSARTFEVGPAQQIGMRSAIGTFPTDTVKVADNVSAGSYNLGTADNADACGLSVLEFMFFRQNALSYFSSPAYQQYGTDVLTKIQNELNYVLNQWQSGYRETFVNGTGTESSSSFSQLVNEFNKDYELTKTASLGIPMGKYSLGILRHDYVEARYSGYSLELATESFKALQRVFNGNAFNGSEGIGFDDYLNALDKSSLSSAINSKYSEIFAARSVLNGTLEYNLDNNLSALDHLYLKVSEMVVLTKTDMASSFGVLITYQDNDGD